MIWAALLVLTTFLAGLVWLACSAQSGPVVLAAVVAAGILSAAVGWLLADPSISGQNRPR